MIKRDDRTESIAAFVVTNKAVSTMSEKGPCKRYRKFDHEEEGCFEIISTHQVRDPTNEAEEDEKIREHDGCFGDNRGRGGGQEATHVVLSLIHI